MVDPIIGQKFGPQNQLEVVSVTGGKKEGGQKFCYVTCSVCSQDEAIGPEIYKILQCTLKRGNIPCHCYRAAKLTEDQQKRKLNKACETNGIEFLGFVDEYKSSKTLVHLKCRECGYLWSCRNASSVLAGQCGCSACKAKNNSKNLTKPDAVMIENFMKTGKFREGTAFTRDSEFPQKWSYKCPVCSVDEYVQNGLCSGVFNSTSNSLRIGNIACRCGISIHYTGPQRAYQFKKRILEDKLNYTFLGWKEEFKDTLTQADIVCNEHGPFEANSVSFLMNRAGCPNCSKVGFSPALNASVYVMRICGGSGDFTGYGISRDVTQRLHVHRRKLRTKGFTIEDVETFAMTGQEALDIERLIKANFIKTPQDVDGFRKEATAPHLYSNVIEFIQSNISSSTLQ